EETLYENYVIANAEKRKTIITNKINELEKEEGFHASIDEALLQEVTNLVEYPTAFSGSFAEQFLHLPTEVLIISMREHQRYFPVYNKNGELLPRFISVRNGTDYANDNVIQGNEKVLQARLADAQFFYEEDLKHSIDFYLEKLDKVTFQEKLGSMKEKVTRVQNITKKLADILNVDQDVK